MGWALSKVLTSSLTALSCWEELGGAHGAERWQLLGDGPGKSKKGSGHVGERLEFLLCFLNLPFSIYLSICLRETIPSYGQSSGLGLNE